MNNKKNSLFWEDKALFIWFLGTAGAMVLSILFIIIGKILEMTSVIPNGTVSLIFTKIGFH